MEQLKLTQFLVEDGEPDIFDNFFKDHSIDIQTGALIGRYICEERDTLRKFQCWVHKYDPENRFANAFTSRVGLTPRQSTNYDECPKTSDDKRDDE